MKFTIPNTPLAGPPMLFTDPRMRSPSALGARVVDVTRPTDGRRLRIRLEGFGDAGDGPAMDAALSTLNTDMVKARTARMTNFLLVNGADIDTTLSNYQNMISYLSGDGYQGVLAGTTPFSTGNADAPGWIEVAQGIENGLASTTGVISRTNFTSIAANVGANLPGPGSLPWWAWVAIGLAGLVVAAPVLTELVGWSKIVRRKRSTAGYRRRRR